MNLKYRVGYHPMRLWTAARSIAKHPRLMTEALKGQDAMGRKLALIRSEEMKRNDVDVVKLRDFSMHLRPDDGILSGCIYECGGIDPRMTRMFNEAAPGKVVVDVGANLGWYTLNACAHGAKEVHAIEPEPTNAWLLRRSLGLNGFEAATVYECALGEDEGTATLYYQDDCNSGSPSLVSKTKHSIDVPCKTLKSLGVKPDVLKIDVEYAEPQVLMGGLGHVPEMFIEYGRKWKGYETLADFLEGRYRMEIVLWTGTIPIKKLSECRRVENIHLVLRK